MISEDDGNNGLSLAQNAAKQLPSSLAAIFNRQYTGWRESDRDQVVSLNTYFRQVLGHAPISTLNERSCLRDDLDPSVWLKYFVSHVVPTLVRFNLPTE